ncbi:hypothetical protein VTH06DRAFT_8324 [Thermothelomyces fergusii]
MTVAEYAAAFDLAPVFLTMTPSHG